MRKLNIFLILLSFHALAQEKTLDYFLQHAQQNSPLLADKRNQVESLKYDSIRIRALYKPLINFNSNNLYAPIANGYGYDRAITNGGQLGAQLGTNITLTGRQNLGNQFESVHLQKQSLDVDGTLSLRDMQQNVSTQYITAYGEQQMLHSLDDILNLLSKEDTLFKRFAEDGVYSETDYLLFLVSYRQQQLNYGEKKLQIKNDLALLNYLSGIVDTVYSELTKPSIEKKSNMQSEQTITFRKFFIDSLILKNSYDQVKFNYKPHVNLTGDAGYLSSLSYQAEKNFGASIGLNVSIPISDGHQRNLRYEKIKLSERTRGGYVQFFKTHYSQQLLQLQQQISSTENLVADAEKQLTLSDALVLAYRKLLLTGDVKVTDYILSVINYISAQGTVLQLQISELQLINEFNYLNY